MEWLTPEVIGSVGFPIVVASYLLTKIVPILNDLTLAVNKLAIIVEKGAKINE